MSTEEITKMTLAQDLFNELEKLDKVTGIRRGRVNQLRETYGRGILKGKVVFTPPSIDAPTYGKLVGQIEDENTGELVSIDREITDPQEIIILGGFQHEAKSKQK